MGDRLRGDGSKQKAKRETFVVAKRKGGRVKMKKLIASAVMLCCVSGFADAQQEMKLHCKFSDGERQEISLEGADYEKWMVSEDLSSVFKFSETWYEAQVSYYWDMRINKDKLVTEEDLFEELPVLQRNAFWVDRYDMSVEHIWSSDFKDTEKVYGQCETAKNRVF